MPQLELDIEGYEHIQPNADKDDRGWFHLQTARQLCPVEMLVTFDQDPEGCVATKILISCSFT